MCRLLAALLLLSLSAVPATGQMDRSLFLSFGRASTVDGTGRAFALQAMPFAKPLGATTRLGVGLSAWLADTRLSGQQRQLVGAGPLVEAAYHPIWRGPWLVGTLGLQYAHLFDAEAAQAPSPLALRIPSEGDLRDGANGSLAASWGFGVRQVLTGSAVLSLEYARVHHALTSDPAGRSLGRASLGVGLVY